MILISFEQLQGWSQRKRVADVIRWLNERHIIWTTDGKGRPVTTVSFIESGLRGSVQAEEFDFDA